MKIVTSIDSMAAVEAMVNMLESREWAEHAGVCDVTRRLESCITTLHNEIGLQSETIYKQEESNVKAVDFLSGQSDGLGELASEYRREIWRLRDGVNKLINERNRSEQSPEEATDRCLAGLVELARANLECCPPLQEQKIERYRYASAFDALFEQEESDDLRERSRIMRVIVREINQRYTQKEHSWLAANVGFSQSLWEALYKGHIDELEQDVLVQMADMLIINIIPGQCEPVKETRDDNHIAKIAHAWARTIVVHARAMNQTGVAERYMVPKFCEHFKISKSEWHYLEMMNRMSHLPDALPISRLIQIAKDGDVALPVVELDNLL